jgi:hypothetical protein
MTDLAPDSAIKPAATILLLRDQPEFEVLMVKRHHQIDFASGALVFPGGKSHGGDEDPRWQDMATGWDAVGEDGAALRIDDRLAGRIDSGGLGAGVGGERILGQRAAKSLLEPRERGNLLGSPDE